MVACVIFLLVGAILLLPIPITAMGHLSVVPKTYGGISLRVFNKSVFAARAYVRSCRLLFVTAGGKRTALDLSPDKSNPNALVSHLDNGLFRVLDLRLLEVYATAGVENDAMATALALAALKTAFDAGACVLASRYAGLEYRGNFVPDYHADRTALTFRVTSAVSLSDIIYAFTVAAARKLRQRRKYAVKQKRVTRAAGSGASD